MHVRLSPVKKVLASTGLFLLELFTRLVNRETKSVAPTTPAAHLHIRHKRVIGIKIRYYLIILPLRIITTHDGKLDCLRRGLLVYGGRRPPK